MQTCPTVPAVVTAVSCPNNGTDTSEGRRSTMKVYQALLPLAAAMMIAGCGNRGTAQNVVGQADGVVTKLRPEASVTAPNELKAAETTLAHMKQNFDERNYKVVVADVPQFNTQVKALEDAMAAKQTADAAATQEWSTLATEVPKSIE